MEKFHFFYPIEIGNNHVSKSLIKIENLLITYPKQGK